MSQFFARKKNTVISEKLFFEKIYRKINYSNIKLCC